MIEAELVAHVARTTDLPISQAKRLVTDILAWYGESVEQYVNRRHQELKTYGAKNDQIFVQLQKELAGRPVIAPQLTTRQLRRMIYG